MAPNEAATEDESTIRHVDDDRSFTNTSQIAARQTVRQSLERDRRRLSLRDQNVKIWQTGPQALSGTLDSNMKKNTGFIKRVRQGLNAEGKVQLTKEASTLNLDKYVEELAQAVPEGLARCTLAKDCIAAAEIVTALHARFEPPAFVYPLTAALTISLAPPSRNILQSLPQEQREKEESGRISRQKPLLRAAAELALIELLRPAPVASTSKQPYGTLAGSPGQEWLFTVVRDLLVSDREHANVPILITLLKALGPQLLGPRGSASDVDQAEGVAASDNSSPESVPPLVDQTMSSKFRKLCETYFATLSRRIVNEHQKLQEQDRRNYEAYIKSGDIFEDRQQRYEKLTKGFERSRENGQILSELLGMEMPHLSENQEGTESNRLGVNLDSRSAILGERSDEDFVSGKSPWEDEDTRRFYEDVVDLADMIPASILGAGMPSAPKKDETSDMTESNPEAPKRPARHDLAPESDGERGVHVSPDGGDAGPLDHVSGSSGAHVDALLARLPEQTNRSMIDSAAVEFALLNSKVARKRLVKHLTTIPRNRSDLIPYYARLVATLGPYMPDVAKGVLEALDDEFRYLQKKRMADLAETRARNARFLGELAKFKVTPLHTVFHCFKVCLDDFSGSNIEILATLLETCGRYLLRSEGTSERMRSLLEMLRRKRAVQNLDHRQLLLLDNAYYQCNPPEHKAVETKVRSAMELYIRHLLYDVLNRRTFDKVLKLLRKLAWSEAETVTVLGEIFIRVWRFKFSNVYLLALLLADLQPHHPDFVIAIIDAVCEEIRTGMEQNLFKYNQRRTAMVQYLAELYIYRLVNSTMIFDQLWSFVTFGHPDGQPLPGQVCALDAPDDFFRLRLICVLLDTCGPCFNKGSLRKRLDEFLPFLNLYILSKEQPLPMDVDFMLADTLGSVRPDFALERDWSKAAKVVDDIMARQRQGHPVQSAAPAQHQLQPKGTENRAPTVETDADEDSEGDEEFSGREDLGEDGIDGDENADGDDDDESEEDGGSDSEGEDEHQGHRQGRGRNGRGRPLNGSTYDGEEGKSGSDSGNDGGEGNSSTDEDDSSDDTDADADGVDTRRHDEDDDPVVRRRAQLSEEDREAEADFERELAKMMSEVTVTGAGVGSLAPRHQQRSNLFDQGLPFVRKSARGAERVSGEGDAEPAQEGQMRFELLSKKGNRHQAHAFHLPSDSAIAVMTREKQRQEQLERRQLKEYVLGYEGREDEEDRRGLEQALNRRGARGRDVGSVPGRL